MAIKLADTLAPMADFPAVMAEHTAFEDGETLQEKYETGQLGGGGGGYTQLSQAEYDALTDDEKMNGKEYRTYDTGHIYKLGIGYGKDAYFTSLSQLGLTADATIEDVVNALKSGESFLAPVNTFTNYETIFPNKVPNDKWNKIHIIKGDSLPNSHIRCFAQSGTVEYLANINNTNVVGWNDVSGTYTDITDAIIEKLGNEILKYPVGKYRINSTTTGNKFIDLPSDSEIKCGLIEVNGTAVGKSPFTDTWVYRMYRFECLTGSLVYTRRLNSGATVGQIETDTGWCVKQNIYTTLKELGLDTTATINDIVGKMANGSQFTYKTDVFDYATEYNNIQYGTVTIHKQSDSRLQVFMTDKDTGNLYVGRMNNTNKIVGWTKVATEEIVHTSLSGNLAGITTVLDLVNALLTEYRATSPKKPIRYVNGEITKTTLTDLPVSYGVLQITVAGWDVVEVRLAHSANGFKSMYYGFVNRISGQESISSITWRMVETKSIYNSVAELNKAKGTSIELVNGEDNTKKIVDTLSVGEQFISFYHNNANQNRFGIDVSYGNLIHELRITKCLDADLTANYATVTAFMNTGCVMSRIYYKTYSTDWSSTKDYVESLT